MAGAKHDAFLNIFLFLKSSKSRSFIFKIDQILLIIILFYFLCKLDFSQKSIITLNEIWRLLSLPSHPFVQIIVFLVVPPLLLALGVGFFFKSLSEHVVIDFIQFLLQYVFAFLQVRT
jgi:hypothetical protein